MNRKTVIAGTVAAFGAVAIGTFTLWKSSVLAQSIGLVPTAIDMDATKGQAQSFFTVTNSGTQPMRARLTTQAFTYQNSGYEPLNSDPQDLTPYLTFAPRELVLQPRQSRQVRLVVRFPPSVKDTEYRTSVIVEPLAAVDDTGATAGQSSVGVVPSIAATVFVRQGNVDSQLEVQSAAFNPRRNSVEMQLRNTGKASTRPAMVWTLKQGGKVIAEGEQPATTIVADSARTFPISYPPRTPVDGKPVVIKPGEYELTGTLVWVDRGWTVNSQEGKKTLPFNLKFTVPAK